MVFYGFIGSNKKTQSQEGVGEIFIRVPLYIYIYRYESDCLIHRVEACWINVGRGISPNSPA
jgi:hypothetical protein